MADPLLQHVLAVALALLFGTAARHKLRDVVRFRAQLAAYRLLPASLVLPAAWLLIGIETGLAGVLLMPAWRSWGGLGAGVLLLAYASAIAINLKRGRHEIDCGCGDRPVPLSRALLLRNGVLIAAAALLLPTPAARPLGWADLLLALIMLPALVVGWRAIEQLLENGGALRAWSLSHD